MALLVLPEKLGESEPSAEPTPPGGDDGQRVVSMLSAGVPAAIVHALGHFHDNLIDEFGADATAGLLATLDQSVESLLAQSERDLSARLCPSWAEAAPGCSPAWPLPGSPEISTQLRV